MGSGAIFCNKNLQYLCSLFIFCLFTVAVVVVVDIMAYDQHQTHYGQGWKKTVFFENVFRFLGFLSFSIFKVLKSF